MGAVQASSSSLSAPSLPSKPLITTEKKQSKFDANGIVVDLDEYELLTNAKKPKRLDIQNNNNNNNDECNETKKDETTEFNLDPNFAMLQRCATRNLELFLPSYWSGQCRPDADCYSILHRADKTQYLKTTMNGLAWITPGVKIVDLSVTSTTTTTTTATTATAAAENLRSPLLEMKFLRVKIDDAVILSWTKEKIMQLLHDPAKTQLIQKRPIEDFPDCTIDILDFFPHLPFPLPHHSQNLELECDPPELLSQLYFVGADIYRSGDRYLINDLHDHLPLWLQHIRGKIQVSDDMGHSSRVYNILTLLFSKEIERCYYDTQKECCYYDTQKETKQQHEDKNSVSLSVSLGNEIAALISSMYIHPDAEINFYPCFFSLCDPCTTAVNSNTLLPLVATTPTPTTPTTTLKPRKQNQKRVMTLKWILTNKICRICKDSKLFDKTKTSTKFYAFYKSSSKNGTGILCCDACFSFSKFILTAQDWKFFSVEEVFHDRFNKSFSSSSVCPSSSGESTTSFMDESSDDDEDDNTDVEYTDLWCLCELNSNLL